MFVLNGSYRAPLIFNDETLDAAEKTLDRLKSGLRPAQPNAKGIPAGSASELTSQSEATQQSLCQCHGRRFQYAAGVGRRCMNWSKPSTPHAMNGATDDQLKPAQMTLRELTGVLGLQLQEKQGSGDADKFIDLLVEVRSEVRKQKLWALSDQIRDKLKSLGVTIEDSKDGTSWRWG